MGKSKEINDEQESASVKRYERAIERGRKTDMLEEMENALPGLLTELLTKSSQKIASQEIAVSMQCIKVGARHKESSECHCGCASKQDQRFAE